MSLGTHHFDSDLILVYFLWMYVLLLVIIYMEHFCLEFTHECFLLKFFLLSDKLLSIQQNAFFLVYNIFHNMFSIYSLDSYLPISEFRILSCSSILFSETPAYSLSVIIVSSSPLSHYDLFLSSSFPQLFCFLEVPLISLFNRYNVNKNKHFFK
jgi:hypothetical protein